ncbi:hypothetical protein Tco_0453086 [Tanacetum coccineum]
MAILNELSPLGFGSGSGPRKRDCEIRIGPAEGLVYIRRNAKRKKDKGKAIMIEDELVQKKSKKKCLVIKKPLDYKNRLMREKEKGLQEMLKLPNN